MRYPLCFTCLMLLLFASACARTINLADTPDEKLPFYMGVLDNVEFQLKLLVPEKSIKPAKVVYLPPIQVALQPNDPPLLPEEVALIDEKLYMLFIANQHEGEVTLREPTDIWMYQDLGRSISRVDLKITHFAKGNGLKRYLIGNLFMRASGAVIIDMEGSVTDVDTGKILATFTAREKSVGNPMSGLNLKAFSSRYCVRKASDDIGFQLSRKLRRFY